MRTRLADVTDALQQQCTDCGFVYQPEEWGDIPLVDREDWECPGDDGGSCGASVDKYELIEPESPLDDEEEGQDEEDGDQSDGANEAKAPVLKSRAS